MFRRWTFGQVLFVLLATGFLVTGFWGVSQSKMILSEKQMRGVQGGDDPWRPDVYMTLAVDQGWRPQAGQTTNVTMTIAGPGAWYVDDWSANCYVLFNFTQYTHWEGECMNSGSQSGSSPDDDFLTSQNNQSNTLDWYTQATWCRANMTANSPLSFPVSIACRDYGAWALLQADLYFRPPGGGLTWWAGNSTRVPYDTGGNYIADSWENDGSVNWTYSSVDNETGPGQNNPNPGDGFTVFEEYRGFKIQGQWAATRPQEKDFFVIDNYNYSTPNDNIGDITNLPSPFADHMIWANETSASRRVNFKSMSGIGQAIQYAAEIVENLTVPADRRLGQCPLTTPHDQSPLIELFTTVINQDHGGSQSVKNHVMGHEGGHAIHVAHCQVYFPGQNFDGQCIMYEGAQFPHNYNPHHNNHYALRLP